MVFYFNGTFTILQLAEGKTVQLTKRGQKIELTEEQAAAHAHEAPLVPEDEWLKMHPPVATATQTPEPKKVA